MMSWKPETHVAGHVAGDVDRILRRTEGGRISQLEIGQVLHAQAGFDRRGDDVDALVDPIGADRLRAEDAAVEAEDQLQAELPAAGIVGRVRAGMNDDRVVGDFERRGLRFVEAGAGGDEVERLEDGGADRAAVVLAGGGIARQHIVGDDARLSVCRSGERDQRRLARDEMGDLDRVADGVDVGIGRREVLVDLDSASRAEREPRFARQLHLRPDADRQHDDVGLDALAARQEDDDMIRPILEMLDLVVEIEFDRLVAHVRVDDRRHLLVERREDMRRAFDHGGEQAALVEILRDLETDVAAADHHRPARPVFAERRHDAIEVGDIVQGEDALGADAGDRRPHDFGARRKEQTIVMLVRLRAGFKIAQAHGLGDAVDRHRLGVRAHVDAIARLEQRL